MTKIIAVIAIRSGGERIPAGDPLDLPRKQAEALVESGSASWPGDGKAEEEAGSPDPAERQATIARAVEGLADDGWTAAGTPKVAAIEAATALDDITAEELAGFKKES